jgi:small redox-active disulfide protein 2
MDIKILGPGCANCKRLHGEAEKAVAQLGMTVTVSKVEKFEEIRSYQVLMTPALVINGEVKAAGRIPPAAEIMTWLTTAAMREAKT